MAGAVARASSCQGPGARRPLSVEARPSMFVDASRQERLALDLNQTPFAVYSGPLVNTHAPAPGALGRRRCARA